MSMLTREDGSTYPDTAAEEAFLRDQSDADAKYMNSRTVGDLIVDVLAPGLIQGAPEFPEEWQSLEHGFIETSALELRALMCALNDGDTFEDGMLGDTFSRRDAARLLQIITKRMEAGAELCRRLRCARWGNPHFGGGEAQARRAKQAREHFERECASAGAKP
jgi:hypothetical protein